MPRHQQPSNTKLALIAAILGLSLFAVLVVPFTIPVLYLSQQHGCTPGQPTLGDGQSALPVNVNGLPDTRIAGYGPVGLKNAAIIMQVAKDLGLSQHAQLIALVTAMQESTLGENIRTRRPDANGDAGLFQLRVYLGWHADGNSIEENIQIVNDPVYATTVFFKGHTVTKRWPRGLNVGEHIPGLLDIKGWESMEIGLVTQKVQRYKRGYEQYYRNKVPAARQIMAALSGTNVTIGDGNTPPSITTTCPEPGSQIGTYGQYACPISPPSIKGYAGNDYGEPRGTTRRHQGNDIFGPAGTTLVAVTDGTIDPKRFGPDGGLGGLRLWLLGDNGTGAFYYAHLSRIAPNIYPGSRVQKGQVLGYMGKTGRLAVTTDNHLHFEFHPCGTPGACSVNPAGTFKPACDPRQQQAPAQSIAAPPAGPTQVAPGRMLLPVQGRFTSPFGYRIHPIKRVRQLHAGQDIAAPIGTPIKAAKSGVVTTTRWQGGYGMLTIIDHGGGVTTRYAHQSKFLVTTGQQVVQGQIIGHVGNTGGSTGPHLHWEVRVNGQPTNPIPFTR